MSGTILIELDNDYLSGQLDIVEKWLEHTATAQYVLVDKLTKAVPNIEEPHIREAIEKMADANEHHTNGVEQLFSFIDRKQNQKSNQVLATVVEKLEEGLMRFQELLGGAVGSWQELHHLLLLNQQAMGAFAVVEQLGLSLGMKEIVDVSFSITHEKKMHQIILQEYMLEMAPISILYKENI
ncbi:hypothetical protein [Gracilibacillus oryzae]|uniref:hypothetical protein n=1 Tax=Gracilibacillus oryzae TaxID=1672701 RepID=UPI001D18C93E|nr:hypothetical protein [Gracilibacillus oryzae]